jgi:UDP-N-acetylmuramyl tripeptide synthase
LDLGAKNILLVLNDRIPDGRDVSWIWDVDFEMIPQNIAVRVSGDRVYDLALRLKYAGITPKIYERLDDALGTSETLYVLPTYSAMLEVRNILKGRKIL